MRSQIPGRPGRLFQYQRAETPSRERTSQGLAGSGAPSYLPDHTQSESAGMGCLGNSSKTAEDQGVDEKERREANKKIEKQLQKERLAYKATHRLLLLGKAGVCGSSDPGGSLCPRVHSPGLTATSKGSLPNQTEHRWAPELGQSARTTAKVPA